MEDGNRGGHLPPPLFRCCRNRVSSFRVSYSLASTLKLTLKLTPLFLMRLPILPSIAVRIAVSSEKMVTFWKRILQRGYASTAFILFVSALTTLIPRSTCAPTAPPPTENITFVVPAGSENHGNPKLLCTPTQWTDIVTFFFANFVAHAATVQSVPGEPVLSVTINIVVALIFPASGIIRALRAIYRFAVFAGTPLKTAARAKALCTVVRTSDWIPQTGDEVECLGLRTTERIDDAVLNDPDYQFLDWKEAKVNINSPLRPKRPKTPSDSID